MKKITMTLAAAAMLMALTGCGATFVKDGTASLKDERIAVMVPAYHF